MRFNIFAGMVMLVWFLAVAIFPQSACGIEATLWVVVGLRVIMLFFAAVAVWRVILPSEMWLHILKNKDDYIDEGCFEYIKEQCNQDQNVDRE